MEQQKNTITIGQSYEIYCNVYGTCWRHLDKAKILAYLHKVIKTVSESIAKIPSQASRKLPPGNFCEAWPKGNEMKY